MYLFLAYRKFNNVRTSEVCGLVNFDLRFQLFYGLPVVSFTWDCCFTMLKTWAVVQVRSISTSSWRSAIQRVTIIGGGLMGSGIAQVWAVCDVFHVWCQSARPFWYIAFLVPNCIISVTHWFLYLNLLRKPGDIYMAYRIQIVHYMYDQAIMLCNTSTAHFHQLWSMTQRSISEDQNQAEL